MGNGPQLYGLGQAHGSSMLEPRCHCRIGIRQLLGECPEEVELPRGGGVLLLGIGLAQAKRFSSEAAGGSH